MLKSNRTVRVLKSFKPTHARLVRAALVLSALAAWPGSAISAAKAEPHRVPSAAVSGNDGWDGSSLGTLDRHVFDLALGAAHCAMQSGTIANPSTLTVIDYSKPSTAKRLWVFDLRSHELLYEELVAHGQGSGNNLATQFSNDPETHRSSIGLFEAKDAYIGKNGYSLRLQGLDAGFNDKALERALVMHGASYVSEEFARAQGRLGRSWGCPALRATIAHELIDHVKDTGLVFAYYPDQTWLRSSKYLGGCSAATSAS